MDLYIRRNGDLYDIGYRTPKGFETWFSIHVDAIESQFGSEVNHKIRTQVTPKLQAVKLTLAM